MTSYDLARVAELANMQMRAEKAEADAANRERRRVEILDWLEEKIGTAWTCNCGYEMYNCYGPTCHNCGQDAPDAHLIAFKLYASHTAS